MNIKERKIYPDIAKGFAIICVIIGHTYYAANSSSLILMQCTIYSFHMPLFFLISGYFAKNEISLKNLILKNTGTLLIPYYVTALLVALYNILLPKNDEYTVVQWIIGIVGGLPCRDLAGWNSIPSIGAIWFLQALFVAQLEVKLLYNKKHPYYSFGIIVLIALASVLESHYYWLPFNINTGLVAAVFLHVGKSLHDHTNIDDILTKRSYVICASLIWLFIIGISFFIKHPFYFAYLQFPLYGLELIGGICGTYVVLYISFFVEKNFTKISRVVSVIGQSTLYILCVHLFELDTFSSYIQPRSLRLIVRLFFDVVGGLLISYGAKRIKQFKEKRSDFQKHF